jgi:hypothetical protein
LWWWLACREEIPETPEPPAWDEPAAPIPCAAGTPAPLLEAAALDAGLALADIVLPPEALDVSDYALEIHDPFALDWVVEVRSEPLAVQCHAGQVAADLDHAVSTPHPVASSLAVAYRLLEHPLPDTPPLDPQQTTQDLVELSSLPDELAQALVPVLAALQLAAQARLALEDSAPASADELVRLGHGGEIWQLEEQSWPELDRGAQRQWARKEAASLYDPARLLAFAVEEAGLDRFAGTEARLDLETELGRVIVAGPGPDAPGELGEVALYLDLGGDDTYVHPAGASSAAVPVALHLDLGGDDTYGYTETSTVPGLLPSDSAGRLLSDTPYSLSQQGRQGSGRFGVGMVFDWGGGQDQYHSLVASQGWGALGVGVLYDDGGDDVYAAEQASQGAGSLGVGLLLDGGGADTHLVGRAGQGFGGALGVGIAHDGAGDDRWLAEPGPVAGLGALLWDSWQLPGQANESLAQGAGSGVRDDDEELYLSGGAGVLRDLAGDDTYQAGVYGQGFGYWQSAGYLLEGGGADTYDLVWHGQGASAHFGVGALLEQGPEGDRFGTTFAPVKYTLGAVNDLAVAVAVNEGGDDTYVLPERSAGAGTCQGSALFVDNDGADTYTALSVLAAGTANQRNSPDDDSCVRRASVQTLGLFLDSGGDPDTWQWPTDDSRSPTPADDSTFGWSASGAPDERGGAIDGDGETSQHASGMLP